VWSLDYLKTIDRSTNASCNLAPVHARNVKNHAGHKRAIAFEPDHQHLDQIHYGKKGNSSTNCILGAVFSGLLDTVTKRLLLLVIDNYCFHFLEKKVKINEKKHS